MRPVDRTILLLMLAGCGGLPLAGAALAGRELGHLLTFPPARRTPADYPHFSWWAVALLLVAAAGAGLPWLRRLRMRAAGPRGVGSAPAGPGAPGSQRLPWWGWLALGWTALWWGLAWNRFPWFAPLQRYTFTPLWVGWIVTVNALTWQRSGSCLLLRRPWRWAGLFAASALFWWAFEWLNRFVLNWHYRGDGATGAAEYAIHASICFSTVLPAVTAGREWLGTLPRLTAWLAHGPACRWLRPRAGVVALLLAGTGGLVLSGAWPRQFFPALWLAPLFLGVALARLLGREGWWDEIISGNWSNAGLWALSALGCGFFWEMWNIASLAHWFYTVPYVERWHVFAMPLAGYGGYLPFGLECGLAVTLLGAADRVTRAPAYPPAPGS